MSSAGSAHPALADAPRFSNISQSGFRLLVENNADGVLVTSLAGIVLYANPAAAQILGKPEEELLDFPIGRPLVCGEFVEIAIPNLPNGGVRDVEMRVVEIVWEGEQAVLASLRDISGRRAEEERRRQSLKLEAIGRLTAVVTHDFKNLVAVIQSGLRLLRGQLSRGADIEAMLAIIDETERGVARAEDLARQLLTFSRGQALSPEQVELNDLIGSLVKLFRHLLGANVELRTALDPKVERIMIDATQLEVALLNLAVNARDAMEGHGTLTIETAAPDDDQEPFVRVSVRDTGCGMDAEVQSKALEPFFTTKSDGSGTGLGLSQVYGFVTQSGGHVRIESQVGKGTAVHLLLPRLISSPGPSTLEREGGAAC
ncbi:PAS domain S-box protein [Sinorhizobium meliloti]|uniref:two-component system sensor histidine kinase NtrB n=1 Tax=Rhizobium meliloti TaxID=382 RepID=UPI00299E885A|nr:PAS domain S-box protein [Sinorhizobium meliloti]MDW9527796.1 PAS domain S-box protein [Sinorhizobium meliloti]MDW9658222.1 PAS domain S-box protein [Sinorhizobium meliloti]MDW9881590.1 PAS domain S-box protein [Sinorhizobium meliloti]MDW9918196.1 PAS domain S-box protein [Sinorhizobium meliloti]